MKVRLFVGLLAAALLFSPACSLAPARPGGTGSASDEMAENRVEDAEFYVFQFDGATRTVKQIEYLGSHIAQDLKDGCFYRVVADVSYLNGGIAGYVDHPQIHSVKSCEEVSPFDIGLPSLEDGAEGMTLIGDYADGDILLYENGIKAVWKDGGWIWRYDDVIELTDGITALVRLTIDAADVQAGIDEGVLACDDYFVLPKAG